MLGALDDGVDDEGARDTGDVGDTDGSACCVGAAVDKVGDFDVGKGAVDDGNAVFRALDGDREGVLLDGDAGCTFDG